MKKSGFQDYQADDFVQDEFFQQWVVQGDGEAAAFWKEWIEAYPEKKEQVQQAILFLRQVRAIDEGISMGEVRQLFHSIEARIDDAAGTPVIPLHKVNSTNSFWARIAAIILMLVLSSAVVWYLLIREKMVVQQTAFGEMKEVLLPDSSLVVLNGNSQIRYAPTWQSNSPREVWLEGEGYFKVLQKRNGQTFLVRISAGKTIEVLGTTFSATNRESVQRVVLSTGKVRFTHKQAGEEQAINLKPGDMVELKEGSVKPEKRRVNPAVYTAWTEQVLMFDDTPLGEVVRYIEDNYGLHVEIADSALYQKKLAGSTPIDPDLELLFKGLEETFGLIVTRHNGVVTLKNKVSSN